MFFPIGVTIQEVDGTAIGKSCMCKCYCAKHKLSMYANARWSGGMPTSKTRCSEIESEGILESKYQSK